MTPKSKGFAFSIDEDRMTNVLLSALDALKDEVLIVSKDFRVVAANARVKERIGDMDPVGHGLHCHEVHARRNTPCGPSQHPCVVRDVLRTKQHIATQHMVIDDFGNTYLMEVEGTPIIDADGEIQLIVQTVHERSQLSEPNQSERTAHSCAVSGAGIELDHRKTEHAHNVESLGALTERIAHDFNNLMVGVLGNTEFLLETVPVDSPIRDCLNDIFEAAKRAADLSKQMSAYTGKHNFTPARINLEDVVENAETAFESGVPSHIVLRYDIAPDLPVIDGDIVQIRRAVQNLISNAREAVGDASGVIRICAGRIQYTPSNFADTQNDATIPGGEYGYIEVSDTGIGMDPGTMKKIFDPRFTTKGVGRGLGLATVLGIVRSLNGAIELFSQPREGTTVRLLFPAQSAAAATAPTPEEWTETPFEGKKALLVDDEHAIREVAQYMLEHLGFTVQTAKDGVETLKILETASDFDLILLDYSMPVMDGEACFHAIRKAYPYLRVVLSSGHGEQEMVSRFSAEGPSGYIQKPYRLEQLRIVLEQALHDI